MDGTQTECQSLGGTTIITKTEGSIAPTYLDKPGENLDGDESTEEEEPKIVKRKADTDSRNLAFT